MPRDSRPSARTPSLTPCGPRTAAGALKAARHLHHDVAAARERGLPRRGARNELVLLLLHT
eukprot:3649554-Rhodomonas_salina.1